MWKLSFISEENFTIHVKRTIKKYVDSLKPFNLQRFNKNTIDPIKLIFDKTFYQRSWEEVINNEISRQRDKSVTNSIGYFHQEIFQYIPNCSVPSTGWDVIYHNKDRKNFPEIGIVKNIYVEMKNKHNTMNSSSSQKTFMRMQNQLLKEQDCACFLVEAIAEKSQNQPWNVRVDGESVGNNKLLRRVSLDQFYTIVTGQEDAFYQMCMILPSIIENVVKESKYNIASQNTVIDELNLIAKKQSIPSEKLAFLMAIYMLGFRSYQGFSDKYSF